MINFITEICTVILVGLIINYIGNYIAKKDVEKYKYRGLYEHESNDNYLFDEFYRQHSSLSKDKALKLFYSIPENYNRAEKIRKENVLRNTFAEKRVYAREHDNFIFSLFAPLAEKTESSQWTILNGSIPDFYIKYKIAEFYKIRKEDANKMFEEFVENNLLMRDFDFFNNELVYSYKCYTIGLTLSIYANIVNKGDLNLSKWIEKNGKSKSKKELLDEIKNTIINPPKI